MMLDRVNWLFLAEAIILSLRLNNRIASGF